MQVDILMELITYCITFCSIQHDEQDEEGNSKTYALQVNLRRITAFYKYVIDLNIEVIKWFLLGLQEIVLNTFQLTRASKYFWFWLIKGYL